VGCGTSCFTCAAARSWTRPGCHALLEQSPSARSGRYNFAVVRGSDAIDRLLQLSGVAEPLVLVGDPADLVPPSLAR
jgi:hypothetical protein